MGWDYIYWIYCYFCGAPMTISDREYQSLKDSIDQNHKAVMDLLALRKDYWDERLDKICSAVGEMKDHCRRQQDTCAIVLKDFDKRISENDKDITRVKTIGGVVAVLIAPITAVVSHIIKKIAS